ncbi:unnamed protein product [Chironomus riparius]|uniref:Uncharacterized protein n=1 Tax=Chironomus riparius TaxID=315576 RepID=A0A9N9RTF4_9DIPT|nr:unnamed protein product [Chironomus riparius]
MSLGTKWIYFGILYALYMMLCLDNSETAQTRNQSSYSIRVIYHSPENFSVLEGKLY